MKLGVRRREVSTTSVANVLQVLCQTVVWKLPNMREHRNIIEFPRNACWRSWMETYKFFDSNKFKESYHGLLKSAFYNRYQREESCVNSFYRMAQHAAFGDVGVTKNSETLSAGTSVTSSLTGNPEVIESGHSTVLPWTPIQDPEVYRSAVEEAMKLNELPWEIVKDFGSIEQVHMDLTFPLRWSFVERREEDGGAKYVIHHLDRLCPIPDSPQLLHWEAIRDHVQKPLLRFRHIMNLQGPTRTVTKIKGYIPSSAGEVIFDVPAALAIANSNLNANGGKRPICSGVSDPALLGIQLKVGDEWIPLADLLEPEEISRLKRPKRIKEAKTVTASRTKDLMVYSRDIKPDTFNPKEPNIDENMPKQMFGYTKKNKLMSTTPGLFQYAIWDSDAIDHELRLADPWDPNESDSDNSDEAKPPRCNCVFTSFKTEFGESVDVAVYQADEGHVWILFPTRRYVFKIDAPSLLPPSNPKKTERLQKLIVYAEQQSPSGSRRGPWVKQEMSFGGAVVVHDLWVEDRQ